jgi:hypothetical protein
MVHDLLTGETVRLDSLTTFVWKNCDGAKSPWKIQQEFENVVGAEICEDDVWKALARLSRLQLLDDDSDESIRRYQSSGFSQSGILARSFKPLLSLFARP